MILLDDVLKQHRLVIHISGGADGVRDYSVLESAMARPFQTFGDNELYPTILEKTAALLESIIVNHPFVDGNKRTGYTVARTFLKINGYDLIASQDARFEYIMAIASGKMTYEDILHWLQNNTQQL